MLSSSHQAIINKLYASYESKGFIREGEALDAMSAERISLADIDRLTDQLLSMGVIFADDVQSDDENDLDRAHTDYEEVY